MANTAPPIEERSSAGSSVQPTIVPPRDLRSRFPGRYLSLMTFKRDGTGVATPLWFVSDGERLLALTDLHSAKIRRARRNPHVLVASCRPWGRLRMEPVPALAHVLTDEAELQQVHRLLVERYGISYRVATRLYRFGRRLRGEPRVSGVAALSITLD